ncbi:MAG: hypothetical protein NZZ41_00370 [Candidatus Dojkabacteria bacterium]|nr:hypothetical protein [Candidatus Dojkabacteria bacterium]
MKKRIIPFWLMPGSWGLRGKTREIAKIEYYYDGEEKERKILDILYENDEERKNLENLKLDLKYGKISEYDYQKRLSIIKNKNDEDLLKLEILELNFKYKKISKYDYEKEKAEILKKPWVGVSPESGFDETKGKNGFLLSLDYNSYFIEMLRESGYTGKNDNEIIDNWFKDVMLSVFLEERPEEFDEINFRRNPPKSNKREIETKMGEREIYS